MPHLVQILLPVFDNQGRHIPAAHYDQVRTKIIGQFGGLTAYTRVPAEGLWQSGTSIRKDDIVVVEVMDTELDRSWWQDYQVELEQLFRQDEIVIRAQSYEAL